MVRYKVQNVMLKLVSVKKSIIFSDLDFHYSTKFAIERKKVRIVSRNYLFLLLFIGGNIPILWNICQYMVKCNLFMWCKAESYWPQTY